MAKNSTPQRHILPSSDAVLEHLAALFVRLAGQAIATHGRFSVALSGGSSPQKLYELLASPAYRSQVAWARVFFFFGDERYVPSSHPDSNYRMAREALLEPLGITPNQVVAVDTSLSPAAAARHYTEAIAQFFAPQDAHFDLVLLGLGSDAHTASLFPHTPVLTDQTIGAREVFLAEKQTYRITLTAPLINQAYAVAFLVYGSEKAKAVQHVLLDEPNVPEFPAQLIAPAAGELHWFLDEAAAAQLPPTSP